MNEKLGFIDYLKEQEQKQEKGETMQEATQGKEKALNQGLDWEKFKEIEKTPLNYENKAFLADESINDYTLNIAERVEKMEQEQRGQSTMKTGARVLDDDFSFFDNNKLTNDDLRNLTFEFLLKGFIAKNEIVMLTAKEGEGKTYLTLGFIKRFLDENLLKKIIYINGDNNNMTMKIRLPDRKIDILDDKRLSYISIKQKAKDRSGYLEYNQIIQELRNRRLKDCLIIIDSLYNLTGDLNDEKAVKKISDEFLRLRDENNATILFIHHKGKAEDSKYRGSQRIAGFVDTFLCIKQESTSDDYSNFTMWHEKSRNMLPQKTGLRLDKNTLQIEFMDFRESEMKQGDEAILQQAKEIISEAGEISKPDLLEALGFKRWDKLKGKLLDKGEGLFYKEVKQESKGKGAGRPPKIYAPLDESLQSDESAQDLNA